MTTQTEALKLALEALEREARGYAVHDELQIPRSMRDAITAIKEALAQPEQEPVSQDRDIHSHMMVVASRAVDAVTNNGRTYAPIKTYTRAICTAIQADKNLLAKLAPQRKEPEQEPVAWRGYNWGHSPDDWVYRDFDDPILDGNGNNVGQPLYTAPYVATPRPQPQSEARGLSQSKPLTDGLPCCRYTDATAIKWNEFNHAVQCHNCGHTYTKTSNEPLTLEYIDQHIGADEGDREAVVALVREVEAAHGIKE